MGGESDNFQVTLSPCTVTRLPTELGRGSMGKADYQAKNKYLSLCMQDSYQALASPPFYLLPLFLKSTSTNKLCKRSATASPPSPVGSARACKAIHAQPQSRIPGAPLSCPHRAPQPSLPGRCWQRLLSTN